MISLTLFALAILWVVFLCRYPWLFARERPRSSGIPRYHYYVCGSEELPTWQRKNPASTPKSIRTR